MKALLGIIPLLLPIAAQATQEKTYSPYWAWDNNFNNSAISWSPGTGTNPQWSVGFNFSSYNLYGYPASVRGWHYGYNPSGDKTFPKQLSAIKSLPASFSYASGGTNMAGDFAYDMFFRRDSTPSTPQLEVMVWGGNNSYPIGSLLKSAAVTENGVTYDLWAGNNKAAGYYVYTFIPQRKSVPASLPTSGSANVDLKVFFNALQGRSSFSNSLYLDVVEAGCEITRGDGWVATTWFQVNAE
jgi:hypothetical protein